MIDQKKPNEQLPEETCWIFKELRILEHLKQAGLKKCKGFTCAYLFQLLFSLVFHQKNLYQYLKSKKDEEKPEKNAIYRFLNHPKWNWRQFLLLLGAYTVQKVSQLTSASRISAFIVDDSSYERNRSKKSAPNQVVKMLERALRMGISAP